MSRKSTVVLAAAAALACGAVAFYWIHMRGQQPAPEVVSAEPPGFHASPPAKKPVGAPAVKSAVQTLPANSKKILSPADTELPLRTGEVLEYSANISNLNNQATLKLPSAD